MSINVVNRLLLITVASVLTGLCTERPATTEGWRIHVDLAAAKRSAGAEWIRVRPLGELLAREVVPGYRVDDLWQSGTSLTLATSPDGAWSNAVWEVEGDWESELLATVGALPLADAAGSVRRSTSPLPEIARDRLQTAGAVPDMTMSVRAHRFSSGHAWAITCDGNKLRISADAKRLADTKAFRLPRPTAATADGAWLTAVWTPVAATSVFSRAEVTARDSEEGGLRVEVTLQALNESAAEQGERGMAGLLRMFENMNDDAITSSVRDSLRVQRDGKTVHAVFEEPARAFRGLAGIPALGQKEVTH